MCVLFNPKICGNSTQNAVKIKPDSLWRFYMNLRADSTQNSVDIRVEEIPLEYSLSLNLSVCDDSISISLENLL